MVSQNEIHRMAHSRDVAERWKALKRLDEDFLSLPDKELAWKDLLSLTKDEDYNLRGQAVDALAQALQYMTDKEQALNDLLLLTKDKDSFIRMDAAFALGTAFQYVTNKEQVTKKLLELAKDEDSVVRGGVAFALGMAFQYVTDKENAAKELLELINDEDNEVRRYAASALGPVLQYVTDKEQITTKMMELINDEDSKVRMGTAYSLGLAFQYISDKEQTIKELLKLTTDEFNVVRVSANYSLGKISIYKAIEAEGEGGLKDELENAIGYFEKSSQESKNYFNPAKFCLPFYRSFYAITSGKKDAETDVGKYFEEAKNAVEGSDSKEKLLEAVTNLSEALKKAHETDKMDFDTMKSNLNAFRRYCDRACELLDSTEGTAPSAVKLMRRGLPIIDERIKKILAEIQEKSEALCKKTKGTAYEDLGKETNRIGKDLSIIRDPISLEKQAINLEEILSAICDKMSEEKGEACRLLEKVRDEQYIEDKLPLISMILSKIPMQLRMKNFEEKLDKMLISVQPTIQEKFEISTGIEIFGTGGKHIVTIPIQDISSPELKEQLKSLSKENKTKLDALPAFLKEKVKEYLMKKDIL